MRNPLTLLSSLRLTAGIIAVLLLAVLVALYYELSYSRMIVAPVILLTLNLVASIWVHPAFKRYPSLLMFHIALAILLPVALYGSLSGFVGRIELPEGAVFSSEAVDVIEEGPLHDNRLSELKLSLTAMEATYVPGKRAQRIRARVWIEDSLGAGSLVIAEHLPLMWQGYQIYASKNLGFSGNFDFIDTAGNRNNFAVNFPWYAGRELEQANEVTFFDTPFWVKLEGVEGIISDSQPIEFRPPKHNYIVIRQGEMRTELRPGKTVTLAGGRLVYNGLQTWQGFEIRYDSSKRWLLAIALVMIASMSAYFIRRFSLKRWDET